MTNRERFHATINNDPRLDRCPVVEWVFWWDETIKCWEAEGMPKGMSNLDIQEYFGLDKNIPFWLPHYASDCPWKAGHGAPLIKDEADYREIKKYLFPVDAIAQMEPSIEAALPFSNSGDAITFVTLEGFFWMPRRLFGIEPHMYAFYDYPVLYHRICEDLLEFHIKVLSQFSQFITADFMTIAEDMSYNNGPMLSEVLFEEFIAPYYRRLIPEAKKHGVRVFVDTDGDFTKMMDWLIRAGIEGILPMERQAGVDIVKLQSKYPDFLWLGGFDKMSLLKGKDAIDAEFERILPAIRKGGYVPSVDHQTPPGVSMENYRYYVAKFKEIARVERSVCNES